MTQKRFILQSLIILAMVFAGVSPACHFVSGKSFIEICAADGSVQRVEVDGALDPFAEPLKPHPQSSITDTCPFCFTSTNQDDVAAQSAGLAFDALSRYVAVGVRTLVPVDLARSNYNPRGPPVFS